jgi:phage tail-like protein
MQLKPIPYPIPTLRYRCELGGDRNRVQFGFRPGIELETIEYRDGSGARYRTPGRSAGITVTLRRGSPDSARGVWANGTGLQEVDKHDISISLTNESGSELHVTWNVPNAFPTKCIVSDVDADGMYEFEEVRTDHQTADLPAAARRE